MVKYCISILFIFISLLCFSQQQLAVVDFTPGETSDGYQVKLQAGGKRYASSFQDGFPGYDSINIKEIIPMQGEETGIKYYAYNNQTNQRILITTAAALQPIDIEPEKIPLQSTLQGKYIQVGAFSTLDHAKTYIAQKDLMNTEIVKIGGLWKIVIPFDQVDLQRVRTKVPDAFVTDF